MICPHKRQCKLYDDCSETCNRTGGEYYEDRDAGCKRMMDSKTSSRNGFKLNHKNILLFLFGIIILTGLTYATTIISDSGISTPSIGTTNATALYADNIYFGNIEGSLNATGTYRPLTTNGIVSKTVCVSGCDYTKINNAIKDVPLLLRHKYTITVKDSYNQYEDVYVPTIIAMNLDSNEGSVYGLSINGNGSNLNGVKIKSLQVSNPIGQWAFSANYLQVNGTEPTSDEGSCISVYGDGFAGFGHLNITGNCTHAIMGYGSGIYVVNSYFNNQSYGLYIKRKGVGIFGDDYCEPVGECGNSSNRGILKVAVVRTQNALIEINSENEVIAPNPASCTAGGNGIISYKGTQYCLPAFENIILNNLTGVGNGFACLNSTGGLYRSASACA